jgi:hypothetical protein
MESLPPDLVAKVLGNCAAPRPTPFTGTADWLAAELAGGAVPLCQLEPLRT